MEDSGGRDCKRERFLCSNALVVLTLLLLSQFLKSIDRRLELHLLSYRERRERASRQRVNLYIRIASAPPILSSAQHTQLCKPQCREPSQPATPCPKKAERMCTVEQRSERLAVLFRTTCSCAPPSKSQREKSEWEEGWRRCPGRGTATRGGRRWLGD